MEHNSSGVGLPMIIFIVFLILKLTHTIEWSWWWVTSPLWISAGLAVILFIIVVIMICAGGRAMKKWLNKTS